ncbi:1,4-dihydroxy-2-naphthoate octaprenyltransferase [Prevotella cerevisiae]|uniref:1,4-dihydroxy-2-naphthoate octaprenyltransferase n=1 Tax=Segatella cerevisiae TaxID=2053716 RepID=A0ABT1BUA8_9BACT|nr:1,4-dihydroxy-2-naphthoate octaprenyltransferase [Segatella cerevisiae]MCO6024672.1 1,4-dihydroxy-2-naphthoate octaprenyltransferase [Segatella cerevisiae]
MNESDIKTNSFKAWILAARPKTLSGAAVPVMIGTAFAWRDAGVDYFQILPAILCFLFAFIMQIDANFINDYFDGLKGNDDRATRLGPKRACSEGWITLPRMRTGIVITTLLACATGLPLIFFGGMWMIAIGVLCVLFCFLYTTKLSYLGLGDLLVLLFFGIVPVCFTYFLDLPIQFQQITWEILFASIACGLVVDSLLIVNNYRDRDNDKRDGKMTLVVKIGAKNAERLYLVDGLVALLIMVAILANYTSGHYFQEWKVVLSIALLILYGTLHYNTYLRMKKLNHGKELNRILGMNARNMFLFGLIVAFSVILI